MKTLFIALLLCFIMGLQSCNPHPQAIEGIAEDVLKQGKGIEITFDPVDEKK